jgi:hypothetical protein
MTTKKHVIEYFNSTDKDALRPNGSSSNCLTSDAVTLAQDSGDHAIFLRRRNEKSTLLITLVQRLKRRGLI